jgi:lysophospholipase L1-like esterase
MTSIARFFCILLLGAIFFSTVMAQAQTTERAAVKVFWLAGQSNMQGQGVVDLDHPEHYNNGKGTLVRMLSDQESKQLLAHTVDSDGSWITRDDVLVRYQTQHGLKTGGLTVGFTGYEGKHHIGPEFQFGHLMGEQFDEPVLLIKTAWGGKSLHVDFRPPSSGGETGKYYHLMLKEFREALSGAATDFPSLKDRELQISGFVWQQGWNDMVDESAAKDYEQNLVNLINDLRNELEQPDLPFVVGELGNGGEEASESMKSFRIAQQKATGQGTFTGNVAFVKTSAFARPKENSPNVGHGHHWFGNAESYFLIGDALGKQMLELISNQSKPKVLILGDSISIGYMRRVQQKLADFAFVCRPTNLKGGPENCAGTTNGVKGIERWLKIGNCQWDLIHFNFGLHDLKHVDPQTRRNSNNPTDPPQATLEEYEQQLRTIVSALKSTNAKLIFATTTPVPEGGVKPFRDPAIVEKYNDVARRVMKENGIVVNDLYDFAEERLDSIQAPVNVHFTREGSVQLGNQVATVIAAELDR